MMGDALCANVRCAVRTAHDAAAEAGSSAALTNCVNAEHVGW